MKALYLNMSDLILLLSIYIMYQLALMIFPCAECMLTTPRYFRKYHEKQESQVEVDSCKSDYLFFPTSNFSSKET